MPSISYFTDSQQDGEKATEQPGDIFMASWSDEKGMDNFEPPVSGNKLNRFCPTRDLGRNFSFSSSEILEEAEEARSSFLTSNRLDDIIQCARPGKIYRTAMLPSIRCRFKTELVK